MDQSGIADKRECTRGEILGKIRMKHGHSVALENRFKALLFAQAAHMLSKTSFQEAVATAFLLKDNIPVELHSGNVVSVEEIHQGKEGASTLLLYTISYPILLLARFAFCNNIRV